MSSSLLERIRNKPPEEKRKLIIWVSAVTMVVVAALWAFLFFGFGGLDKSRAEAEKDASQLGNLRQSFEAIIKTFKK